MDSLTCMIRKIAICITFISMTLSIKAQNSTLNKGMDSLCLNKGQDSAYIERYFEFGIRYNQIKNGFLEGTFAIYKKVPYYWISYYHHEFSAGYSPFRETFILETNHGYSWAAFLLRLGAGYCKPLNNASQLWFVKPEIGWNLSYAHICYSYSFILNGNKETLYNKGSSLSIFIPIASSYRFMKFKDPKRYTWGGIYYQPQWSAP